MSNNMSWPTFRTASTENANHHHHSSAMGSPQSSSSSPMGGRSVGILNTKKESSQAVRSTFKNALVSVPVPSKLLEGIHVLRVTANGMTYRSFLTLSEDKFTLYITTHKVSKGPHASSGGRLPLFRKKSNDYYLESSQERAIDIGAIDRIQRGQQTHKFELAKKSRQDSLRSLKSFQHQQHQQHQQQQSLEEMQDEDLRNQLALLQPNRSFSIHFRGERTLDLMTYGDDKGDLKEILDSLDNVITAYKEAKLLVGNDVLLLRYIWLDVDKDKSGTINASELGMVLDRINFQMRRPELNSTYEKFAKIIGLDRGQRRRGLSFEQSCTFLHKIKRDSWLVKPVNIIWNDLFGEIMNNYKPRMTVSARTFLESFLHKKQKQTNATIEDVLRLFQRLHQLEIATVADSEPHDTTRIDKNRFEAYLLGRDNDIFDPAKERFDARLMTKPISEYWINTSHNTYLTGDQFTSHSSVEMYLNALYRGCRCLELDIWDGEFDAVCNRPIPVVWHGHTMTTKILFVDIIKTLKVFLNFNPDSYPIILSFENHCSIPFQEEMAQQLLRILGSSLYVPTESSLNGPLPSPQELKGMIVIKGRRPHDALEAEYDTDEDSDEEPGENGAVEVTDTTTTIGADAEPTADIAVLDDDMKQVASASASSISASVSVTASTSTGRTTKANKHAVSPQLARLTLFHGTKHKTWATSIDNPNHHMHSFTENKVRSMLRQKKNQRWCTYNQSHMTRTYPAGSRVDSSNYSPMPAWSVGCQLVALNFQTSDAPLRLNDGRFRENGNCGYVLKPSTLMVKEDFHSQSFVPVRLGIRVLSGSCIPKWKGQRSGECINPFVKVSIFDVNNEDRESVVSYSTSVVNNNGFFPIWNSEKFIFTVDNGAVAMLLIAVYDKDAGAVSSKEDLIATCSVPVSCLRTGYRSVQLFDAYNTRSGPFDFASLLIEVKRKQLVAEI